MSKFASAALALSLAATSAFAAGTGTTVENETQVNGPTAQINRYVEPCAISYSGIKNPEPQTGWNDASDLPPKPGAILSFGGNSDFGLPDKVVLASMDDLALIQKSLAAQKNQEASYVQCWNAQVEKAYNDLGKSLKDNGFNPAPSL